VYVDSLLHFRILLRHVSAMTYRSIALLALSPRKLPHTLYTPPLFPTRSPLLDLLADFADFKHFAPL
jgi:hypothetical protein